MAVFAFFLHQTAGANHVDVVDTVGTRDLLFDGSVFVPVFVEPHAFVQHRFEGVTVGLVLQVFQQQVVVKPATHFVLFQQELCFFLPNEAAV